MILLDCGGNAREIFGEAGVRRRGSLQQGQTMGGRARRRYTGVSRFGPSPSSYYADGILGFFRVAVSFFAARMNVSGTVAL